MYGQTPAVALKGSLSTERDQIKPETVSPKVLDLNMEELVQANRLLNNSEMLHYLVSLNNMMDRGYKMNVLERKLLEDFYGHYDAKYNSPLATALSENQEGN